MVENNYCFGDNILVVSNNAYDLAIYVSDITPNIIQVKYLSGIGAGINITIPKSKTKKYNDENLKVCIDTYGYDLNNESNLIKFSLNDNLIKLEYNIKNLYKYAYKLSLYSFLNILTEVVSFELYEYAQVMVNTFKLMYMGKSDDVDLNKIYSIKQDIEKSGFGKGEYTYQEMISFDKRKMFEDVLIPNSIYNQI